jgi:hypothetical protein
MKKVSGIQRKYLKYTLVLLLLTLLMSSVAIWVYMQEKITASIIEKYAVDYREGGEGVGYHKVAGGDKPVEYQQGEIFVIGGTYPTEWLELRLAELNKIKSELEEEISNIESDINSRL